VETLEARMEHLEAEFEGLQDGLSRQAVLEGEHVGGLRRRTSPERLARDLARTLAGAGCDRVLAWHAGYPALLEDRELVRTAGAEAALALETSASPPSCALATTTCAPRARGWSPRATRRAAGSSATCTDGAQRRLVSLSVTLNLARRHAEPGSRDRVAARQRDD
jgi:hypothetical protein